MASFSSSSNTWTMGKDSPSEICRFFQQQADNGVRYFCFDFFDTLVVRDIMPEYTKQLAAKIHSLLLDSFISAEELYAIRQQLEKRLCEQNAAAGGELEFYLDSFAREYLVWLRDRTSNYPLLQDEETFCQLILGIETAVERAVQRPCKDTVQVLDYLKQQGFVTVLISDFYLAGTCFNHMLKNVALHDRFDHVFISADYGLAKGSGRLYDKVCSELDCRPEQMLMIGDNLHSDVNMAKDKGVQTIHLQNPQQQLFYQQWQPGDLTAPSEVEKRFSAALQTTGPFQEISSTLWYFSWLLLQELQKRHVEDVFFFSKEGEFLKKLFDCLQDDLFGCRVINSHYILVSRKATFLASLRPLAEEDFSRLFTHYRDISLRDFLLSLNIEESVAQALCRQVGLDFQKRCQNLKDSPEFKKLLDSSSFQELYESRRTVQRQNFITYLDSFGVNYEKNGLTIVDVGWKGSIQDNIYHILQGRIDMQGFFVGSLIATEKRDNNTKKGLLFDDSPQQTPYFHVYNNNRSLFEMMLGASHGSADGYFTPQQFLQLPDDHQREISRHIKTDDGELLIATVDLPEERILFEQKIKPIQEQVYRDACTLNRAYLRSGCTLPDPEWFARRHARMVFKPTRTEVDFFESLYHLENFGIFEYTDFRTDAHLSVMQRLENLKNIRKDPSVLEMGTWPPIILRRLGLDFYRHINGYRRYKRAFK